MAAGARTFGRSGRGKIRGSEREREHEMRLVPGGELSYMYVGGQSRGWAAMDCEIFRVPTCLFVIVFPFLEATSR